MSLLAVLAFATHASAAEVPSRASLVPTDGWVLCDPYGTWDGKRCVSDIPDPYDLFAEANRQASLHNAVLANNLARRGDVDLRLGDAHAFLEVASAFSCDEGESCDPAETTALIEKLAGPYFAMSDDPGEVLAAILADTAGGGVVSKELAQELGDLVREASSGKLSEPEARAAILRLEAEDVSEEDRPALLAFEAVTNASAGYWAARAEGKPNKAWGIAIVDAVGVLGWWALCVEFTQPHLVEYAGEVGGVLSEAAAHVGGH